MHIYVSTSLHHWTFILQDDVEEALSHLRGSTSSSVLVCLLPNLSSACYSALCCMCSFVVILDFLDIDIPFISHFTWLFLNTFVSLHSVVSVIHFQFYLFWKQLFPFYIPSVAISSLFFCWLGFYALESAAIRSCVARNCFPPFLLCSYWRSPQQWLFAFFLRHPLDQHLATCPLPWQSFVTIGAFP